MSKTRRNKNKIILDFILILDISVKQFHFLWTPCRFRTKLFSLWTFEQFTFPLLLILDKPLFRPIALLSLYTNHICCFRNCSPSWRNRLSLRIILFLDESLSSSLTHSLALFWTNIYSFLENYSPSLQSMISGSPACRAVLMCVAALELDVSEIILD